MSPFTLAIGHSCKSGDDANYIAAVTGGGLSNVLDL
jgi:hypothetical protein